MAAQSAPGKAAAAGSTPVKEGATEPRAGCNSLAVTRAQIFRCGDHAATEDG